MKNKVLADQSTPEATENRAQALPDFLALPLLAFTERASSAYGIGEEERSQTRGGHHDEG